MCGEYVAIGGECDVLGLGEGILLLLLTLFSEKGNSCPRWLYINTQVQTISHQTLFQHLYSNIHVCICTCKSTKMPFCVLED